jgi:hypothetical protein
MDKRILSSRTTGVVLSLCLFSLALGVFSESLGELYPLRDSGRLTEQWVVEIHPDIPDHEDDFIRPALDLSKIFALPVYRMIGDRVSVTICNLIPQLPPPKTL